MPLPMISSHLAIIEPTTLAEKLKGSTIFLTSTRGYVENNIKKIMELITEA